MGSQAREKIPVICRYKMLRSSLVVAEGVIVRELEAYRPSKGLGNSDLGRYSCSQ